MDCVAPKIVRQIRKVQAPLAENTSQTLLHLSQSQPSLMTTQLQLPITLPPVIPRMRYKTPQSDDNLLNKLNLRLQKAISQRVSENRELSIPLSPEPPQGDDDAYTYEYEGDQSQTKDKDVEDLQNVPSRPKKVMGKPKQIKTKQPSLPLLPQATGKVQGQYYNKWYIPYDQRYIKKQRIDIIDLKSNPYAKDDKHFYKNLHNIEEWLVYDPFESKVPPAAMELVLQSKRLESLKEMLKGSKVIQDYKRVLESSGARVPVFIKQVIETDERV